jgi:chromosome partitioning protein
MTHAEPTIDEARDRVGQVISIAQQKGGTGKTTLSIHLAVACLQLVKSVVLIDLDPQATLTRWYRNRVTNGVESDSLIHRQTSGWRVERELETLKRNHDLIILDNPPHAETGLKIAIRSADLLLVPVQLSPADHWAMQTTLDLAAAEDTDALIVYNRVPPRGRSSQKVRETIERGDVAIARTNLGNRIAFSASLMSGLGITEFASRSPAAAEIMNLANEILERCRQSHRQLTGLRRQESYSAVGSRLH